MTGEMLYKSNRLPEYADKYGFILVYPSTPNMDRCWGVHDPETLTHGGAGDSQGILSMANYLIHQYNANWARFFVMGVSSGGMMSNVLAAVYPELISGAAVFSGVPHACFAGAPAASPASAKYVPAGIGFNCVCFTVLTWDNLVKPVLKVK
jgi:poly(3-hydroxybutyrate) depolymerase